MSSRKSRKYILETKNNQGNKVMLKKKTQRLHEDEHPELADQSFIDRVRKNIEIPWRIYESKRTKQVHIYYCKEEENWYTKVVIRRQGIPYEVLTAFETDKISEVVRIK